MNELPNKEAGRGVQAVLWDIDGTLIDTEPLHYQVIAEWCGERGFVLGWAENEKLLGKSMREKWDILNTLHDFNEEGGLFFRQCGEKYRSALRPHMQRKEPVEVFRRIASMGIAQACVSNGDSQVVKANLRVLGLEDLVAFCITGEQIERGKPDPEPYLKAAEKMGLQPHQCLAVEDSTVGLEAAVRAKMHTVAWPLPGYVAEDYGKAEHLIVSSADFPWEILDVSPLGERSRF